MLESMLWMMSPLEIGDALTSRYLCVREISGGGLERC